MTTVITIKKLKIYDRYLGDEDAYARSGRKSEKAVFGDDEENAWGLIRNAYANLDLIGRGASADGFTRHVLEELKTICDVESFGKITYSRDFYKQFQSVGNILVVVKSRIYEDSNTAWTNYTSPQEIVDEVDSYIENIRYCSFEALEKVSTNFLPTGIYHELAASNGWADLYLALAEDFDKAYTLIKKSIPAHSDTPINYELYKSFAEATEALINLATGMTWNKFSNDYVYILSEIKDSNKDSMERRRDMIAENKKKKPVPLEELLPVLEKIYDNVYDFNLYVYKATKEMTVIDIRYYPKMALDAEYRKLKQDDKPMMHCKVPIPWWRSNDKLQFDIHWEHHVVMPWWKRVFKLKK
jgi:hypothetical protein